MPVTETEIEAKVIDIVSEQMGVDRAEITRETSFANDLNADSLDTVELVMEFEDEFNTPIPDDEAEKIQTVGQAISYILKVASS
ncbi:MAG: acyl carrier protein [Phycisphaerales bacterium]|nr:acyl carrier protein [Phycisphaerales bacterium]